MPNSTAAIIKIGNEILSGKTLDTNTQTIAKALCKHGVDLVETRTIADHKQTIVDAVLEFSNKYTYVFTTGGIGPTHDDITSESISAAFEVNHVRNQEVYKILEDIYEERGEELNSARIRMAYIPEGSSLIYNKATRIPGFTINNVYSLAGVPNIMEAMLEACMRKIPRGLVKHSKSITIMISESSVAVAFSELQNKYTDINMGSYPFTKNGEYGTTLVLRSQDKKKLHLVYQELGKIIDSIK
jgi:molybdenum cofactor synthesis domain-containing protein